MNRKETGRKTLGREGEDPEAEMMVINLFEFRNVLALRFLCLYFGGFLNRRGIRYMIRFIGFYDDFILAWAKSKYCLIINNVAHQKNHC